jgi:GT2 family glycosyltransferase
VGEIPPVAPSARLSVDVSVVVVSYNVCNELLRCLESVQAGSDDLAVEIIVVDNASGDGTAAAIDERFPAAKLVVNPVNQGFSAANNQGIRLARGAHVLFLNPDTVLAPQTLGALVDCLRVNPDVGVVGPRLCHGDGQLQPSRRHFPTPATALMESAVPQRWWPDHPLLRHYNVGERPDNRTQDVDWLVGACLLARREVLDEVGGFDERFFMYSEELDWCRRVRLAGWHIRFVPTVEVMHFEGRSSEQNLTRRATDFNESKCRYFEKHYGYAVGRALRVYLLANTLYDLGFESVKLALGHRVDLRKTRIKALRDIATYQLQHLAGSAKPAAAINALGSGSVVGTTRSSGRSLGAP